MSVDVYRVPCWYIDEFFVTVENEFKHMIEGDKEHNIAPIEPMRAFEILAENRGESTRSQLYEIVGGMLPEIPHDVDITYKSFSAN